MLRDIHVGNANLAGLADQRAGDREILMLNLLDVGHDLVFRKLLSGLRNLLVLIGQIFKSENLVNTVLFN